MNTQRSLDEYASVLANLYFHGLSGYLVASSNEALKWAEISKEITVPRHIRIYYGEYRILLVDYCGIYLEKGKKEAQEIYERGNDFNQFRNN